MTMTLLPPAPHNNQSAEWPDGRSANGRTPAVSMAFGDVMIESHWHDAMTMMKENNEETGILTADEFSPSLERYKKAQEAGMLRTYVAFKHQKLIGYAVFFIVPHMHSQKVIQAIQDVMYVAPAHRGITAIRFLDFIDASLAEIPVHMVYRHVNVNKDYSRTLERRGYEMVEAGYVRRF